MTKRSRAVLLLALAITTASEAAETMTARQAGARHGQALGVALVCYGLHTTPEINKLASKYRGSDADDFKAQSEKVLLTWKDATSCKSAGGPNECRLLHEWSCRDAVREIGPNGTAVPGLVEAKK